MFRAVLIESTDNGPAGRVAEIEESALPEGSVAVAVEFSSLNYKDALAVTGTAPIARTLPMVAGIDLAGTVTESSHPAHQPGDAVLATGYGLGERHWGGLSERARLDGDQLLALPPAFTTQQAMAIGTAGFTAMLCVLALEDHGLAPGDGPVLVTGANGGVGSIAVAVLAALGHEVVASTGRAQHADELRALGATEILDREELAQPGKALSKMRWAGAVDAVGGQTLASICASLRYGATVAACGNAGGMGLPASVAPFILRAVKLIGIDSVECPRDRRAEAWQRLAQHLDLTLLDGLTSTVGLSEVPESAARLLAGEVHGRVVVDTSR